MMTRMTDDYSRVIAAADCVGAKSSQQELGAASYFESEIQQLLSQKQVKCLLATEKELLHYHYHHPHHY